MKKHYTLILLLFVTILVKAQIPNNSFETWSNGLPTGWYGFNTPDTLFVQSGNAWEGSSALRLNVSINGGITFGSYIFSGDSGTDAFFATDSVPQALYGWYISHPADSGDALVINSSSFASGNYVGEIAALITDTTAVYKQFVFNYSYYPPCASCGDSASIEFGLQNQTDNVLSTATYFIVDDLTFGPAVVPTGVTEVKQEPVLEQCVPNPASNTANIIYSITGNSTVNLVLYDLTGRRIKTLLDNTNQSPGRYKVPTDVGALSGGIYFYCLDVNGQSLTQKLVVSR